MQVPDGKQGAWEVKTVLVSEEESQYTKLRRLFDNNRGFVKPGVYKQLCRNKKIIMSNVPDEIRDHSRFINLAKHCGGNVLISGLGLGVCLTAILESDKVESVTVIEKSDDVIRLTGPSFEHDKRVAIVHADVFGWKPPRGKVYDFVWHDIWDNICSDNLKEMERLHRKFGKRALWQGSWCKEECRRMRREGW